MKTTIYIPDELGERLERWKERINVSAACQEALDREVRRLESIPAEFEDLPMVVDRLRGEKEEWDRRWYEIGTAFGAEYARNARYESLKRWASSWKKERGKAKPKPPVSDPVDMVLWDTFGSSRVPAEYVLASDLLTRYPSLKKLYGYDEEHGSEYQVLYDEEALAKGWADSVLALWEAVEERL